jgi:hypothetical protein
MEKTVMPAFLLPAAIAGISALSGLLGGRKQTAESNQNSNSNFSQDREDSQTSNTDQTSSPSYDPFQLAIRDYLLSQFQNRANSSQNINGLVGQGLSNINTGGEMRQKALDAILAGRGLSRSNVAVNASNQLQSGRIGESIGFLNQVPQLQRQMQMEDLNNMAAFFKSLPVGQRTYGTNFSTGTTHTAGMQTGTQQGTQTNPGNMLAGMFSGLGQGLFVPGGFLSPQRRNTGGNY